MMNYGSMNKEEPMRLEQLRFLIEIAKSKSLSVASEALHISQQALSLSVKEMEKELGFSLLLRSPRGIRLTEEGRIFTREINKILYDYDLLVQKMSSSTNDSLHQTVRIGIQYGILESYFSEAIEYLYREVKSIKLELEEASVHDLVENVKKGSYDIGILAYNNIDKNEWKNEDTLEEVVLFRAKLGVKVAPNMALYDYDAVSIKTILKENILMYCSKSWDCNGVMKVIQHYAPGHEIIIDDNYILNQKKLLSGKGVSFGMVGKSDDKWYDSSSNLKIIPFKEDIEVQNVCLRRKNKPRSLEAEYILNIFQMWLN